MNNRKKIGILVLLGLSVVAYFGYTYMYHDHRDIQSEAPSLTISSSQLVALFESESTEDALNKTLVVSGVVTKIDGSLITLDDLIDCVFEVVPESLYVNERINVKGRCVGFDDLMGTVKLDQCQIIN